MDKRDRKESWRSWVWMSDGGFILVLRGVLGFGLFEFERGGGNFKCSIYERIYKLVSSGGW